MGRGVDQYYPHLRPTLAPSVELRSPGRVICVPVELRGALMPLMNLIKKLVLACTCNSSCRDGNEKADEVSEAKVQRCSCSTQCRCCRNSREAHVFPADSPPCCCAPYSSSFCCDAAVSRPVSSAVSVSYRREGCPVSERSKGSRAPCETPSRLAELGPRRWPDDRQVPVTCPVCLAQDCVLRESARKMRYSTPRLSGL